LADDHDHLRADGDLGAPALTQLVEAVDSAGDRHEPPDVGGGEDALDAECRRNGTGAVAIDRLRSKSRGTIRLPDLAHGSYSRAHGRRRNVLREQDLDRSRCILDDDPASRAVEEARTGRDGRFDGDDAVRRP
jgi:hypothetical protein